GEQQKRQAGPGSARVLLATLLVGYACRLSPKTTLYLSVGAGLTRDTPDVVMTMRVPIAF
ncbi:acetate kinase, partial [Burkholderia pseudomallei]|nr:acetate kinase [Burkholderia pseudomallei]